MRAVVLTISLLFTAALWVLTARDIAHYGLSALDVIAILILVLFTIGILGAAFNRRPPPPH